MLTPLVFIEITEIIKRSHLSLKTSFFRSISFEIGVKFSDRKVFCVVLSFLLNCLSKAQGDKHFIASYI